MSNIIQSSQTGNPLANRTELVVILDESGSMLSMAEAAVIGFSKFMDTQRDSGSMISTYTFSYGVRNDMSSMPVASVRPLIYQPHGGTALLDAIGTAINDTIRKPPTRNCLFLIISDGGENASKVFARALVRKMVTHAQDVFGWKFAFVGTADDGWRECQSLGIPRDGFAEWTPSPEGMAETFRRITESVQHFKLTGILRLLPEPSLDSKRMN